MKQVVILMVALLIAPIFTVLSAAEVVKVGNYNISIDFAGTLVNTTPRSSFAVGELGVIGLNFITIEGKGSVAIAEPPGSKPHTVLVSNCKSVLEMIMKISNINVDVTPYEDGFVGTGEDFTGSPTYGFLKPVDVDLGRASRLLITMVTSKNETFSKQIIMSAKAA